MNSKYPLASENKSVGRGKEQEKAYGQIRNTELICLI